MPPPKPATTPLELLAPNPDRVEPFLNKFWGPLFGGVLGFVTACAMNFGTRRPLLSGIQKHVGFVAAFGAIGNWGFELAKRNWAENDAILRRYVELHPDDFALPGRKKFADVLNPWVPIR